jgi:hypothetical protein
MRSYYSARINGGRNAMKLKNIGYAAFVAATALMLVLGSAATSEAKGKKKAPAPKYSPACSTMRAPVCATKGGMKFTYVNSCFAGNDGASVNSNKACPVKAAKKGGKKKGGKKKGKKAKAKKK